MIQIEHHNDIAILTMDAGENRWNTTFVRAFAAALDEIEASDSVNVLVTQSSDPKFFSNGLDLEWRASDGDHPGGDRDAFGAEFMGLMGRVITLPIPTVCAIGGHAFGAGFMLALCHDVRLMREDRGFLCANEVAIGMVIPDPEMALFKHKLPSNTFFKTVQLAHRWSGGEAEAHGIVESAVPLDALYERVVQRAEQLAPLGKNRKVFGAMKEKLFGETPSINASAGAAHLLKTAHH